MPLSSTGPRRSVRRPQRVGFPPAVVDAAVLALHTGLECGDARDLAADMEQVVEQPSRLGGVDDSGAAALELRRARHVGERAHRAVGRLHRTRAVHAGMHVRRDGTTAVAELDHLQCAQHGTGMVPMSVRQHDGFDTSHVEAEAIDVALEHRFVGSGVEQQRVCRFAAPGRDGT